jgi:flavin-dependent dehydrogenase
VPAVRSGAELREGCRVTGLVIDDGRVAGVKAVTPGGEPFFERAAIGADGPSSRVATAVRATKYASTPALQGTAWNYWDDVPLDHFELHLRDSEAVHAFPSSHDSTLIGVNWSIDRFRAARADIGASYFDVLRRAAPELAERAASAARADDDIHLGSTRSFFRKACGSGWVLLGDAHYEKDPCTAQGITDAFCDAELLADAIDDGLRGDHDLLRALDEHESACVARTMPFSELTRRLATFAPPDPEMRALYTALRDDQEDTDAIIGLLSEAVSPTRFFAPGNVDRILTHGAAREHDGGP